MAAWLSWGPRDKPARGCLLGLSPRWVRGPGSPLPTCLPASRGKTGLLFAGGLAPLWGCQATPGEEGSGRAAARAHAGQPRRATKGL